MIKHILAIPDQPGKLVAVVEYRIDAQRIRDQ
jgi:hypothetical protein